MSLQIFTFNLMAPVFTDPDDYPATAEPFIDPPYRRGKWLDLLATIKNTADIISLQEVTDDTTEIIDGVTYFRDGEYKYIKSYLDSEFSGQFFSHDRNYWAKYFDSNPSSSQAYTKNGNALFLKRSRFNNPNWTDLAQSTGNHAVLGQAIDNQTNKTIQIVAVHLDSDVGGNRKTELQEILNKLSHSSNIINIVAGDFNAVLDQGNLKEVIDEANYKDVMIELSVQTGFPLNQRTFPNSSSYYNSPVYKVIDHVIYRSNALTPSTTLVYPGGIYTVPGQTRTGVLSNNLFLTYPELNGYDSNEGIRLTENIKLIGSDHFPVITTFDF